MSSFTMDAKNKVTGEIVKIWCLDDFFGKHKYGYIRNTEGAEAMTEGEFYRDYEPIGSECGNE